MARRKDNVDSAQYTIDEITGKRRRLEPCPDNDWNDMRQPRPARTDMKYPKEDEKPYARQAEWDPNEYGETEEQFIARVKAKIKRDKEREANKFNWPNDTDGNMNIPHGEYYDKLDAEDEKEFMDNIDEQFGPNPNPPPPGLDPYEWDKKQNKRYAYMTPEYLHNRTLDQTFTEWRERNKGAPEIV